MATEEKEWLLRSRVDVTTFVMYFSRERSLVVPQTRAMANRIDAGSMMLIYDRSNRENVVVTSAIFFVPRGAAAIQQIIHQCRLEQIVCVLWTMRVMMLAGEIKWNFDHP